MSQAVPPDVEPAGESLRPSAPQASALEAPLSRRQLRERYGSQTSEGRLPETRTEATPGLGAVMSVALPSGPRISSLGFELPPNPSGAALREPIEFASIELPPWPVQRPTVPQAWEDSPAAGSAAADTHAASSTATVTRAVTPIAGGASTGAGPARRPSRLSQATVTNDAGRTIEGPVYRSTFLSAPEAVPVVPVVSTSSAVVVWLLALLPLAQLALIVVLAALHLPPGIGYVLLVAPSLGLPLSTALRRGRANDREKQPTARMIFSVVPPLYRLDPSVPLDAAGMAPVITWLLLEGIAAAVLLFA